VDQRDASGLMHRRNRQYDPATGRFTQEDPIGIAGGLNLYGFGGGDAGNYKDPYGLCVGAAAFLAPVCVALVAGLTEAGSEVAAVGPGAADCALPDAEPSISGAVGYAERELSQEMQASKRPLDAARRRAVQQAWQVEQEMVQATGQGTREWTRAERKRFVQPDGVVTPGSSNAGHTMTQPSDVPSIGGLPMWRACRRPGPSTVPSVATTRPWRTHPAVPSVVLS
jgi:RHS repeat-associated protein